MSENQAMEEKKVASGDMTLALATFTSACERAKIWGAGDFSHLALKRTDESRRQTLFQPVRESLLSIQDLQELLQELLHIRTSWRRTIVSLNLSAQSLVPRHSLCLSFSNASGIHSFIFSILFSFCAIASAEAYPLLVSHARCDLPKDVYSTSLESRDPRSFVDTPCASSILQPTLGHNTPQPSS